MLQMIYKPFQEEEAAEDYWQLEPVTYSRLQVPVFTSADQSLKEKNLKKCCIIVFWCGPFYLTYG